MAITKLTHVTIIVDDQDNALQWYTEKFGFVKVSDDSTTMPGYRWLTVSPAGQSGLEIVLFQARDDKERSWIGQGTLWVFQTDDCHQTCQTLEQQGVTILSPPQEMPWGTSATVADLYGNPINLLQPAN